MTMSNSKGLYRKFTREHPSIAELTGINEDVFTLIHQFIIAQPKPLSFSEETFEKIYDAIEPELFKDNYLSANKIYIKYKFKLPYSYAVIGNVFRHIMKLMKEQGKAEKVKGQNEWLILTNNKK